ncbi:tripartite tricarboxylate transporter substrate binding protein [Limnohabitans sp. Rim8]|uniref:tripartite tricarboxylate transporter substrate binding protein n=1 Tax=Limnohabitans sp. Rim8 TaxID=1100718 RepID=UPI003305C743
MKHSILRRGFLALLLCTLAGGVGAQAFPSRPIHLVVAFPAGGGADVLARAVAQKLTASLGQPVIVDNRVGASGIVGSDSVAKSPPDGHTLLLVSTTQAIASKLYAKVPFDLAKSFAPVAFIGTAPLVLVVHPSVQARTLGEFMDQAKVRRISYASAANGTVGHLSMEMLKSMAKFDMLHVPYRGTAPATNDLLGGQVDAMMDILPNALPYIKAGRMRALAVTSLERAPDLPETPTMAQAGIVGFEALNWYGVLAPSGTPPAIVGKLNSAISAAIAEPDVSARLTGQGYVVNRMTPEAFGALIEKDLVNWDRAIKVSGTKPD